MPKLTDAQWADVRAIRVRSKSGRGVGEAEMRLLERAHHEDPDRYRAMSDDVHDDARPFGAPPLRRRGPGEPSR